MTSMVHATHNFAGEIEFEQTDENTLTASVITYTNLQSTAADRDSLYLCWGDGLCDWVQRVNGPDQDNNGIGDGEVISTTIKKNIYTWAHTYTEAGQYILYMTDPNRSGGIINVNFPNSDNVPFHLEALATVLPGSDYANNRSPILLEAPIDLGYLGAVFMHTPNGYDQDGDSISYKLIVPLQDLGVPVPNYVFPRDINPSGQPNDHILNPETGLFYWDAPQQVGDYVIAIEISTYRNGELFERILRDMLITIQDGAQSTPSIELVDIPSNNEIFNVEVGDTVRFEIIVEDMDTDQEVGVNSSSGLYDYFDEPAIFTVFINGNTATGSFEWIVREEHIRQQPYQVVIKADDNYMFGSQTSFGIVRYRVTTLVSTDLPIAAPRVRIFPNPVVNNHLFIEHLTPSLNGEVVNIFNSSGQLVKQTILRASQQSFDVSQLTSGLYILQVGNTNHTFVLNR